MKKGIHPENCIILVGVMLIIENLKHLHFLILGADYEERLLGI